MMRTPTPAAAFATSMSRKSSPISPALEAEDQDMDVARRGLDVLEHPREELRAIDEQLHARRRGGLEVEGEVTAFPAAAQGGFDERPVPHPGR